MISDIKILIIDDSKYDREMIRNCISYQEKRKYNFSEAKNVSEGLEKYFEVQPDCIILDYKLPSETGFDFLKQLKTKEEKHCPVVMLTGFTDEEIAIEAYRDGATFFFDKNSINANILKATLSYLIENYKNF